MMETLHLLPKIRERLTKLANGDTEISQLLEALEHDMGQINAFMYDVQRRHQFEDECDEKRRQKWY